MAVYITIQFSKEVEMFKTNSHKLWHKELIYKINIYNRYKELGKI